ncbi:MAG: tyrosine--tRNA ligase [Cytophagales bacterium]|nr:tyrosine--tRNA ligase [Cytophagales bacterium]
MKKNFVEELRWRGMIHDMTPGTEDQLNKEVTTAYVGMDPTADSLHIGHLVSIMMLKHLQVAGHKPIALLGGATGMIGDPSFKAAERVLLDEEAIANNIAGIRKQLEKFLDFEGETGAEILNNYDWFKDFSFIDFAREAGKHITVNYMVAKDSVKKRMETGISFTEFTYQLLQGWDFYHLHTTKNCKLQMGGSDQWGNIVTGTELIRRKNEENRTSEDGERERDAFALTCPLITKADGTKFGKTESGSVWLDPEKTSPYQFYQFWLNVSDEDASKYIRIFTLLPQDKIEALETEATAEGAPPRILQKALAEDVTVRVHGQAEYEIAIKASMILFGKNVTEELKSIDERTLLEVFDGVPQVKISKEALAEAGNVTTLLGVATEGTIFKSNGESRKTIKGGGVSINKAKVTDINAPTSEIELLQDKFILAQKGKKNYFLIEVE